MTGSTEKMDRNEVRGQLSLGLGALCVGTGIYLLFRSSELLVFEWLKRIGLADPIFALREFFAFSWSIWPSWWLYSLPNALWLFSGLLVLDTIWKQENHPSEIIPKWAWLGVFGLSPFLAELGQLWGAIPGTFDPRDLVFLVGALALAFPVLYPFPGVRTKN